MVKKLKQAKQLIADNQLGKALELLIKTFSDSEYSNEFIQHHSNYIDLNQKQRLSTITFSEANIFKNQIVAAILGLIDDIEKGKKSSQREDEEQKHSKHVINIIDSQNINTGTVNTGGGDFKIGDNT